MAAKCLSATYIQAHLGSGYYAAALAAGLDVDVLKEEATAVIQGARKNSGYAVLDSEDPADYDALTKLGAHAVFRELLANVPESTIPLPDNWETSFERMTMQRIIDGDLPIPAEDPSTLGSVGGAAFTDPLVTTNYARKTTKDELAGY